MRQYVRLLWSVSRNIAHKPLYRNTSSNLHFHVQNARTMYTDGTLGMGSYESTRQAVRTQYLTVEDIFRSKMRKACDSEGTIYMEDMSAMIHILHKSEPDLKLLEDMLKNYMTNATGNIRSIKLSIMIMRALLYLHEPVMAHKFCTDTQYAEFFNNILAHVIAMTLLFKNGMYEQVVDVFEKKETMNVQSPLADNRRRILLYAALAKLNTPDALDKATKVWTGFRSMSKFPLPREINLYIYLLWKQGKYDEALRLTEDVRATNFCHYLHTQIYLSSRDYESAFNALKNCIQGPVLYTFDLTTIINDIPDDDWKEKFLNLINESENNSGVRPLNSFRTVERYVFRPVTLKETEQRRLRIEQGRDRPPTMRSSERVGAI